MFRPSSVLGSSRILLTIMDVTWWWDSKSVFSSRGFSFFHSAQQYLRLLPRNPFLGLSFGSMFRWLAQTVIVDVFASSGPFNSGAIALDGSLSFGVWCCTWRPFTRTSVTINIATGLQRIAAPYLTHVFHGSMILSVRPRHTYFSDGVSHTSESIVHRRTCVHLVGIPVRLRLTKSVASTLFHLVLGFQ